MEVWTFGADRFELNSFYALPDDAWPYELLGWLAIAVRVGGVDP